MSVGPILAVPGMRERSPARAGARRPGRRGVSGIVGGKALKGPADRMLVSLGHEAERARRRPDLAGLVDMFVLDTVDAELAPAIAASACGRS